MGKTAKADLAFACSCGAMCGHITPEGLRLGIHVVCYCHDCRAAQLFFGQPDPAPGPVEILQLAPGEVAFDTGAEHLAAMQLSPKGMLRWYAKCCDAPLATTPRTPGFPFAGFIVKRIDDPSPLGPIKTRGFIPQPNGKQKHEGILPAALGLLRRAAVSRLSGSWKNSPFFDHETGKPVATPRVLTKEMRSSYYT